MHILLTNDDGPPNPTSSPYITHLVRTLRSPPLNHTVSIVVPSQQRSWIGKAHLLPPGHDSSRGRDEEQPRDKNEDVSDVVTPRYYDEKTNTIAEVPPRSKAEHWVLVPGTPATCVQLGLYHYHLLFPGSDVSITQPSGPNGISTPLPKIDLVLSGPNHGRNTTAAFALSSGTLGGALEAAVCGVRAIALSFAFYTRDETEEVIQEACEVSVRIIEKLMKAWDEVGDGPGLGKDVPELYSINIPLVEGVAKKPVMWTWMLDNKWREGNLYKAIENEKLAQGHDGSEEAKHSETAISKAPPSFKWSPNFQSVWKTVEASEQGNDGLTIKDHVSSVTPLRANFEGLYGGGTAGMKFSGEFKL